MRLSLEQTPKAIGAEDLQQPDQDITVVLTDESYPVDLLIQQLCHDIHIILEQPVFPVIRQLGLGLPKKRGDIVLQSPLHPALKIDEMDGPILEHDIPALKIPEHKIFVIDMREIGAQGLEIIDELFFVIRDLERVQKIVFEIKKIAKDRLFPELPRRNGPGI